MPDLGCTVTSCVHNKEDMCDKSRILVEGKEATTSRETCCASFRDAKDYGYKNVTNYAGEHTDVDCEAVDCVFNKDMHCSANHIGISGGNACECHETECSSFQPR